MTITIETPVKTRYKLSEVMDRIRKELLLMTDDCFDHLSELGDEEGTYDLTIKR